MAPSACNAQPWKFIVVTDHVLLKELAVAASAKLLGMNSFVAQAPFNNSGKRATQLSSKVGATIKNKDYSLIDMALLQRICIQAKAEGMDHVSLAGLTRAWLRIYSAFHGQNG